MNSGLRTNTMGIPEEEIPAVTTDLTFKDHMGAVMVRWNINRNNYRVAPGLYALGNPDSGSDIFVTANYKLTFDILRSDLEGINGWILVLDTHGINVWCAAGKGTFGTRELVKKLKQYSIDKLVSHRRLIVPQLGATGIAAHKVRDESGFNVIYGPVRSSDIKTFIQNGYRKDRQMSRVTFNFSDRMKLVPNDFIYGKYYLFGAIAVMILLSFITVNGFILNFSNDSAHAALNVLLAYFGGIVLTPALLPYIPVRAFALKGFLAGIMIFIAILLLDLTGPGILQKLSWFLIVTAITSFMAMNFTGSSTFTSLSGVKKEMKFAMPVQIVSAAIGIILNITVKFI
jgi:hypothetical protein